MNYRHGLALPKPGALKSMYSTVSSDLHIVSEDMGQTVPYLPPHIHMGFYFPDANAPIYVLILRSSIFLSLIAVSENLSFALSTCA